MYKLSRAFLHEAWGETKDIKHTIAKEKVRDRIRSLVANDPFAESYDIAEAEVNYILGLEICMTWKDRIRKELGITDPRLQYAKIADYFAEITAESPDMYIGSNSVAHYEGGKYQGRCIIMPADQFTVEVFQTTGRAGIAITGVAFKIRTPDDAPNRTAGYWAQTINDPIIRDRTQLALVASNKIGNIQLNLANTLASFNWNNTPQGEQYWRGIFNKVVDGEQI